MLLGMMSEREQAQRVRFMDAAEAEAEAPTYEAPTYEAPTYEAPTYEAPQMLSLEAGQGTYEGMDDVDEDMNEAVERWQQWQEGGEGGDGAAQVWAPEAEHMGMPQATEQYYYGDR